MAYLIIGLLFGIVVAIFALQNAVPVTITFLFWVFPKIELVLVILFSAFLGAMFMFILSLSQIWRLRRLHRTQLDEVRSARDLEQVPDEGPPGVEAGVERPPEAPAPGEGPPPESDEHERP